MSLFAEMQVERQTRKSESGFDKFWLAYPKRRGANPRSPAEKKYTAAVKSGVSPDHILSSVNNYSDELREQHLIGTEFVCMASTWLNQKRWLDYAPDPGNNDRQAKIDADMERRGWKWNGEKWERKE